MSQGGALSQGGCLLFRGTEFLMNRWSIVQATMVKTKSGDPRVSEEAVAAAPNGGGREEGPPGGPDL